MKILSIFGLGTTELIIILVIILVLFGARKLPHLMKGVGSGIREFNIASKSQDKPRSSGKEEE